MSVRSIRFRRRLRLITSILTVAIALGGGLSSFAAENVANVPPRFAGDPLVAAYVALDTDDIEQAYRYFQLVADSNSTDAELALYEMMRLTAADEDDKLTGDPGQLAAELLERYPATPFVTPARMQRAKALIVAGRGDEALELIRAELERHPEDQPAEWTLLEAQARVAAGDAPEAVRLASLCAYEGFKADVVTGGKDLLADLSKQGYSPMVPSAERFAELFDHYMDIGYFITAGWVAERAKSLHPASPTAKTLHVRYAGAQIYRSRWKSAQAIVKQTGKYNDLTKEARAYRLIYSTRVGSMHDDPIATRVMALMSAAKLAPGTDAEAEAYYTAGKFLLYDEVPGEFDKAAAAYLHAAKVFGDGYMAYDALWHGAFSKYLAGRYDEAAKAFDDLFKMDPEHDSADRALYWRARSLERLGRATVAEDLYLKLVREYELTYYGLAAEVRLEKDFGHLDYRAQRALDDLILQTLWPEALAVPAIDPTHGQDGGGGSAMDDGARKAVDFYRANAPEPARDVISSVVRLIESGLGDDAHRVAQAIYPEVESDPRAPYYFSVLYSLSGYQLDAIKAADQAARNVRKGLLIDPYRLVAQRQYPRLFAEVLRENAAEKDLDPYLIMGLVKQESAFQVNAHSWAGARGLMQVIPSTGRYIARKRGIRNYNLFDPATSVDFGTWYFARAYHGTGGDVPRTLAGYNAGPGRATRWWGQGDGRLVEETIERISFDETRYYVKIILRNWEMYRRLYEDREIFPQRDNVFALLDRKVGQSAPFDDN
ncbi:MAG: transglycosylase SLT domain-containing protein [Deltaproteobacteria bacterium]|nr:transglycosylase SLT domain-containing protein [Deltaproteobacteria bacterium]